MPRVRVKDYGVIQGRSQLLRPIASIGGPHRLHWRAAEAFAALASAVKLALEIELRAVSGWRAHRWASRRAYEDFIRHNYPSLAEGRKWLAFDSPHETGLAVDIGVGGLWPTRSTIEQQRQRPLHRWLVQHAADHGWAPYTAEPWHWEFQHDPAAYRAEVAAELQRLEPGAHGHDQADVGDIDPTDDADDHAVEADDILDPSCVCEDLDMSVDPALS